MILYQRNLSVILDNPNDDWYIPKPYGLNYIPRTQEFLYEYFKLIMECEWVGQMHFNPDEYLPDYERRNLEKNNPDRFRPHNKEASKLLKLINFEQLKKCNILIACIAWLTIDSSPINKNDPTIPEDLSYGLVLDYPEFVIPYALYCSKIKRDRLKTLFTKDTLRKLHEHAYENSIEKCT